MPESMPVIRELNWRGLFPQFVVAAVLCFVLWIIFPKAPSYVILASSGAIYLVYCRTIHWILASDQSRGISNYRRGRFQEAIQHFEASYNFFTAHLRLDAWRSPIFGVASKHSYRHMALGKMAFCFAQLGNGAKAIALYEQVLREVPQHAMAAAMLRTLRAGVIQTGQA